MPDTSPSRCMTPRQLAAYWGVSPAKVLSWIHAGRLAAINMAQGELGERPRWRITPAAVAEFEGRRLAVKTKSAPRRKQRREVREYV